MTIIRHAWAICDANSNPLAELYDSEEEATYALNGAAHYHVRPVDVQIAVRGIPRWPDGQVREEEPYRCGAFVASTGELCTLLSDHDGEHCFSVTDEDLIYDLWRFAFADGADAARGFSAGARFANMKQTDAAMDALRKRLRATTERPERAPVPAVDRSWSSPDALAPAVPSSVLSAIEEVANAARTRNEAMCECGHTYTWHGGRSGESCVICDCKAFRGAARRRNEAEHFDEDAQVCSCGHRYRAHAGRAFGYSCCAPGCDCVSFMAGRTT